MWIHGFHHFYDKYIAECKNTVYNCNARQIFKVKIFEATHKSVKSVKIFSLKIFRLYSTGTLSKITYIELEQLFKSQRYPIREWQQADRLTFKTQYKF